MAAVDSGVETESESFNEDSSNSLPSTPKVEDEGLHGVKQKVHLSKPVVQQFSVDPPAGLSFDNLRPCLNFGQGYEAQMLGQNYPDAVGLPSFNCKMRASRGVRVVRFYQQSNARSWSKWKLYLGERKLRLAANTNDLDRLKSLLDSGIDPKSCDEFLRTALHLAASKGYTEVVRLLLHYGADPNQIDSLGNTPLHLAVCTNHVSVVTLLLRSGANLRLLDRMGRNPLQLAESKLKLLQKRNIGENFMQIHCEVLQVVEMLKTYLEKTGQDDEAELMKSFSERLTLNNNSVGSNNNNNSDMESSVKELLASLTALNLKKESDN
ncbi:ankyrin repeat domain-containing protein 54 [Daphnia magna]|uniref:Ankyrin repeat domain-containing protein n=2 Tax=Daphnia magna TaxID=35525 RepID=A0A0P5HTZ7_9CRUS|nr:ankyrin repeat domain-containing protein 54 [Daphnia magna]KAK4026720.1 hypothetical protein OUZ56_015747 [Daphnia magna]KZS16772.1 putative Acyl-CoA-binding domain-containing protein 6 [Daphnia magna]